MGLSGNSIKRGAGVMLAALVALAPGMAAAGKKSDVVKPYAPQALYGIETDHFLIYSDHIESETFKQVAAVEQFRFFMAERLPKSIRSESGVEPKLRLFLLDSFVSTAVVRPYFFFQVDGTYMHCKDGRSLFASKSPFTTPVPEIFGEQDQGQLVLLHEYTHHIMARRGLSHYPTWYVEGLADYYSTLQYDVAKVAIGCVPAKKNRILNRITWRHFENVLDREHGTDGRNKGIIVDPAVFYARSWMLTHYMMSDPSRHAQLEDYFARLAKGEKSILAFEAATGISADRLDGILRAYSKGMPVAITEAGDVPRMSGDVTLLCDVYGQFTLLSTVLDTCPSPKHGEWLLRPLKLQRDPVGIAAIQGGKTADKVWAIIHKDPPEDEDDTDGKDKKGKKDKKDKA